MKSRAHNKKRNTGLLYEFLIGVISRSLISGNQKASSQALKILKRHFKPGTELYKEFRLIHALRKTTVSSEHVADNILKEAKSAARTHNVKELDRQKSLLIRDINHLINDEDFYDQQVSEYKLLATVQTLLNDWRSSDADLHRIAQYEDQVMQHLITSRDPVVDPQVTEESPGESRLLMKVMMKKLNEKYSGSLNDDQKALIRAYAFSTANEDSNSMRLKLEEIKESLLSMVESYVSSNPGNDYINEKLTKTKEMLLGESLIEVNDETVTRFMLYTKLASELGSEENDNG